ncbi:MAG: EamA family transporter RarD, partial [Marivivens sp.]|nr:EamA family transporter RarD [Marivivens sp.]
MSEAVKGIVALVVAATVWGLSSLYYAQLRHLPPLEVLCYRSLWSLLFFGIILTWQGRLGQLRGALGTPRKFGVIFLAASLIGANWFGFIFAIKFGYAVEASMGYYIFPLFVVMLGRFVLGESLSNWQWGAVALAAFAVLILAVGLGVPPWIALGLAFTFGGYGLVKKQLDLGPVLS